MPARDHRTIDSHTSFVRAGPGLLDHHSPYACADHRHAVSHSNYVRVFYCFMAAYLGALAGLATLVATELFA